MADTPLAVAKRYFEAVAARDVEAMCSCWAPGGREHIHDVVDAVAPDGVRAYFTALFAAVPDMAFEVVSTTANKDRAVVRWTATGTFSDGELLGFAAHGGRVELHGMDELTVQDGLIVENNAWADTMSFARQIGALPPEGSTAEALVTRAVNARTRLKRRVAGAAPEQVADAVWIVRGGVPEGAMNVFLVRDSGGVLMYDAGIVQMTPAVLTAAAQLGGLTRVVLGHSHADHRGVAPHAGVDVFCHEADRADTESDAAVQPYMDLTKLPAHGRALFKRLLPYWDGGRVDVAGTVAEGDEVGGFEVVHVPGHAPGLIALHRASDGVVLCSDTVYTVDPLSGRKGPARVPHPAFDLDVDQARASIAKLAALKPSVVWPGHAEPVTGDVERQLMAAAHG